MWASEITPEALLYLAAQSVPLAHALAAALRRGSALCAFHLSFLAAPFLFDGRSGKWKLTGSIHAGDAVSITSVTLECP